jgi:alanine or glycine:cation symporter, AGCS family
MWMAALLGMVTKYAEVTLAVAYRRRRGGLWTGGAMLYMEQGLGWRVLPRAFCLFGMLAAFGIGNMVQVNAMATALRDGFAVPPAQTGAVTLLLAALVLMGGIRRIARVAERLIPLAALVYLLGACAVLMLQREALPMAIQSIFAEAFTGRASVGGLSGVSVQYAMRIGVARGLFTNEAGLGSAPIAHATAENWHPARQGLWGAFEVFFDTIVMCTITALVVLTSGLSPQAEDSSSLVQRAFAQVLPHGGELVTLGVVLFAFSTLLAWYYYGERCAEHLGGTPSRYRLAYLLAIVPGAVLELELVWELADLFNGLMALPNLLALLLLAPSVQRLSEDFFRTPDRVRRQGGSFAHLLQGKALR